MRQARWSALLWLLLPGSAAAQDAPFRISIMTDEVPAELTTLFTQMRDEIIAVAGVERAIEMEASDIRETGFDAATAETTYEELSSSGTDLILAFGPVTASVVAGRTEYPVPTILFGGVNRDLVDLPDPGATSGVTNFAYVISSESFDEDLRTFKRLYDFQSLAVLIPPGPATVVGIEEAISQIASELNATATVVTYTGLNSLPSAVDGFDAVYLVESLSISDAEIEALADSLVELGLPSFSETRREDVELGLMATNQPAGSFDTFFRRLALMVEAVINGENLSDQAVLFDLSQTLTMNFTTAQAVGVPIRYSLVTSTEFVGEYINPIAERRYDLRSLMLEALESNPEVASARQEVRISEQDTRTAVSNYLPGLAADVTQSILDPDVAEVSGGQNPQYSTQGTLAISQTIFSTDANANITIQREFLGAQRSQLEGSERDIIVDASNAYFQTLILKSNVEIQNRNLDVTKRSLRIAEQSFAAGQTGRGDVLRLQSESAQASQALVEAVNALEQAFHQLNRIVHQPISREIDVEVVTMEDGAFIDQDFDRFRETLDDPAQRAPFEDWLVTEAIGNSPELQSLDHNLAAVDRQIRLDGVERFLPTIGAGFDLTRSLDRSGIGAPDPAFTVDQFYSIGIQASIPIFDSNRRRIRRQVGQIQRTQLEINRSDIAAELERNVRDVVSNLTNEIAALELTVISEAAAREGLELTQAAYANGAITVVELLDAQTNFLRAQLQRASATYNFLGTTIVLQRLVGHFFLLSSAEENADFLERFQFFLLTRATEPQS